MGKIYYYTVKCGKRLSQGGANGTFRIFEIVDNRLRLVMIHKQNVVTMSPGFSNSLSIALNEKLKTEGSHAFFDVDDI